MLDSDFVLELYYSCYFPENEAFREKVASIVNLFRKKGYNVIMDAMASSEISSQGPTRWAERQIRRANKVLIFLSPGLLKLAVDGCEGMQSQVACILYIRTFGSAIFCCAYLGDLVSFQKPRNGFGLTETENKNCPVLS